MSKYVLVFVLILFIGGDTLLYSGESSNIDVKNLIERIKSAPQSERRVQMNALKIKLRSMNKESRRIVMMDLKKSFSKGKGMPMNNKMGGNSKIKSQKLDHFKKKSQENCPNKGSGQGKGKHKNRPYKEHLPKK